MAPGPEDHFAELAARHHAPLVRFARRRLGERGDEAEDVVQDALIRALRSIREGKRPENESAWLHTIVAHCCADRFRGLGRRSTVELDETIAGAPGVAASDPHARALERGELRDTVAALQELPDAQRRALVGVAVEGHTYEDVGRRHGWTLGATKSLVWRARTNLIAQREAWAASVAGLFLPLRSVLSVADRPAAAVVSHWAPEAAQCVALVAVVGLAGPSVPAVPRTEQAQAAKPKVAHVVKATPARATVAPPPAATTSQATTITSTTAPVVEPAPAALSSDPQQVLLACKAGTPVRGQFTFSALAQARRQVPPDAAEYTNCQQKIDGALLTDRAGAGLEPVHPGK